MPNFKDIFDFLDDILDKDRWDRPTRRIGDEHATNLAKLSRDVVVGVQGEFLYVKFDTAVGEEPKHVEGRFHLLNRRVEVLINDQAMAEPRIAAKPIAGGGAAVKLAVIFVYSDDQNKRVEYRFDGRVL